MNKRFTDGLFWAYFWGGTALIAGAMIAGSTWLAYIIVY